jgi:hypothetical protein
METWITVTRNGIFLHTKHVNYISVVSQIVANSYSASQLRVRTIHLKQSTLAAFICYKILTVHIILNHGKIKKYLR